MIVIKFGGHAMGEHSRKWASEIAGRFKLGERFVIVHGGGWVFFWVVSSPIFSNLKKNKVCYTKSVDYRLHIRI